MLYVHIFTFYYYVIIFLQDLSNAFRVMGFNRADKGNESLIVPQKPVWTDKQHLKMSAKV